MDYPELKACPFCGIQPQLAKYVHIERPGFGIGGQYFQAQEVDMETSIACLDCGYHTTNEHQDDAVKHWNTRVDNHTTTLLRQLFDRTKGHIEGKSDEDDELLDQIALALKPPEENPDDH